MKRIPARLGRVISEETGQGLVEYLLVLTLIAVALMSLIDLIAGPVSAFLQAAITALQGMRPG